MTNHPRQIHSKAGVPDVGIVGNHIPSLRLSSWKHVAYWTCMMQRAPLLFFWWNVLHRCLCWRKKCLDLLGRNNKRISSGHVELFTADTWPFHSLQCQEAEGRASRSCELPHPAIDNKQISVMIRIESWRVRIWCTLYRAVGSSTVAMCSGSSLAPECAPAFG